MLHAGGARLRAASRIHRILLNTVNATQQDTLSEQESYDSPGTPSFSLVADSWLARYGQLRVQVLGQDGRWREWRETASWDGAGPDDRLYRVERPDADGPQTVRFGDGVRGAIPREGTGTVRIIRHTMEFASVAMIGRSNGLPLQTIRLYDLPCRRADGMRLQVGAFDESAGELVWEDWEAVADFDRSGPLDRHFVFDTESGELRFGNDESGAIPAAYEYSNVVLTTCVVGGGERGNIKPDLLTEWVSPVQRALGISVTNTAYASGGEEGESLGECLERAQAEWQKPYCAVTNDDYRAIAMETPGLKVARAHVIPGFAPGKPDSPGAVTVVVVPQGLDETPQPSVGFLGTVARHLDERRLLTTEVHVIAPEYVRVTVHATVVVEPHFMEEARRIVAELNRLLTPLGRSGSSEGWPFGRTVHKGDIFGVISRMNGVAYVQDLWLDSEGRYVRKNAGGDILLPPNGLAYSGEHRIELISRTQL
ncbi:putative baseplate assembly protein [Cohnella faecalis]|uniref:putative baseplate assembly protein n=1 Tax=Cohnella faecalis TaxID=2315694 RepID=UPI000E5C24B3|nr:putative baseplate assembly protein [Cohnella faecalis]